MLLGRSVETFRGPRAQQQQQQQYNGVRNDDEIVFEVGQNGTATTDESFFPVSQNSKKCLCKRLKDQNADTFFGVGRNTPEELANRIVAESPELVVGARIAIANSATDADPQDVSNGVINIK
jgi:hypothetical protein